MLPVRVTKADTNEETVVSIGGDDKPTSLTFNSCSSAPSDSGISVDNATLTFTDTDWNVEQTVTVSAAADDNTVTDTAVISHAAASTDTDYNGITVDDVTVTIHDSSFRIRIEDGDEALAVTEGDSEGEELCFRLSDVPAEDATVTLSPDGDSELHVYPAEFTIAGSDEFCAVVTAGPDPDADNDEATVTLQAAGGGYDGSPAEEAVVTVQDLGGSPPRGVYVSVQDLAIQEGDDPTYVVALTSQPTGDVTIEITVFNDDGSDGRNNLNTVPQSVQPSVLMTLNIDNKVGVIGEAHAGPHVAPHILHPDEHSLGRVSKLSLETIGYAFRIVLRIQHIDETVVVLRCLEINPIVGYRQRNCCLGFLGL